MNINSKINWKPGLELTAETFAGLNEHIDFQQQIAIQAALGNTRMGLLPGQVYNNNGTFVRNTYEIEHLQCMALLPSGRILDVDEKAVITIPILYGSKYYLTVGFSENITTFERKGVPYVRPLYEYAIHTLDELEGSDLMPLARFSVSDGTFSYDEDYIPPTLQLVCDARFKDYLQHITEQLEKLANHEHMVDEFGKRALLHYVFCCRGYNQRNSTAHFLAFTQEIAQAVNYYIVTPHTEQEDMRLIPEASQYDMQQWLVWLEQYLSASVSILDNVVVEDHSIDFDALKAQIKEELYAQMMPELTTKLEQELLTALHDKLEKELRETLTTYIQETLQPALKDALKCELTDELYKSLYDNLYEALYNALYVPVKKEEEVIYTPLI